MPGISRKIAVIILGFLLIALTIGAVVVAIQLQQSNLAPETTAAAGFGDLASKDLYPAFDQFFTDLNCEQLLPADSIYTVLHQPEFEIDSDLKETILSRTLEITDSSTDNSLAKHCQYQIGEESGTKITLEIHTYDSASSIDSTPAELYKRVNSATLSSQIDLGSIRGNVYFYGISKQNSCITNIFHNQNDFERISLTFAGFNCSQTKGYAQAITTVVSDFVFTYSQGLSQSNYETLCDGWARPVTQRCDPNTCATLICNDGEWTELPAGSACQGWGTNNESLCTIDTINPK